MGVGHGGMPLEQAFERGQTSKRTARGEGEQDRDQSYRQDGAKGA